MKTKCKLTLLLLVTLILPLSAQSPVWLDETLPVEQRAKELLKQMTLKEKVLQMMYEAPAIERLGVPQYNWWNECLHGVARAGLATVYPQAIALAATFDEDALLKSASIISDEAVAKHYEYVRKGERGIYQGLTFWSPNINIFRDPRWGRGQETYGEDPFLTARMGLAFVKGLQGSNKNFYKVVATAKHFAVHSGPESERHRFDATPTAFDLNDTYLPAFKTLVQKGNVASVMCAYNRLDGQPCCGNNSLLVDILRNKWNFNGYVVSDCGAIDDFYQTHKTSPGAVEASAQAVRAGTDLECGNSYRAVTDAVEKGYLSEKEIDNSLCRLFSARIKLGLFASVNKNPYEMTPYSIVDSPSHRQDALLMAQKSIVLLKNENNTLPLSKNLKKIAVVGPCANDSVSLLGNYNGTPSRSISVLQGIKAKLGASVEVVYKKGIDLLNDRLFVAKDIDSQLHNESGNGFKAEYFNNIKLEGTPVLIRNESRINFKGGVADEIAPGIKALWMSARWSSKLIPDKDATITFKVAGDDGFRLFINGQKVMDHFSYHEEMTDYYNIQLEKGKEYTLCLEYFQGDQGASIHFETGSLVQTDYDQLASEVSDADAIVFVGGISPSLEGEEMPVNLPGFNRGDRTIIELPEVQSRMIHALATLGKPLVFVMQTGSALSINREKETVPAILCDWYGGQSAGTAVADVLFGDYNPGGRLPVTFYKSEKDLPSFEDYAMKGRTYRYFEKTPLFPFGFGMSYTKFKYSDLRIMKHSTTGKTIPVAVTVKNIGTRTGDEVVQLYLSHQQTGMVVPRCALKGFKRVSLKKNEKQTVVFQLSPEDMSLVDVEGIIRQLPGEISVFLGGGQPGTVAGITASLQLTGEPVVIE